MTYNKLYKFLKNSILILSLLIGVKSYAITYDDLCRELTVGETKYVGANSVSIATYGSGPAGCENYSLNFYIPNNWNNIATAYINPYVVYNGVNPSNSNYISCYHYGDPITIGATATCDLPQVLNYDGCGCECPIEGDIFFEPTQTCVPECVEPNMDYTSNGGCACNDGFTFAPDGSCVSGDDPTADDDNDGIPNWQDPDYDNDGDGISNGVDEDWLEDNPTYDPTEGEDTYEGYCDSLPYLVSDSPAGSWYKSGSLSICGIVEQNIAREGETTYVSRVDGYTCAELGTCVVKLSSCILGEYYNEALGTCALPREDVVCTETLDYLIADNSGVCQKNFLCDDGSTVYASESIDCPAEGTAEANATTNISDQQVMVDALKQYGSATESGQKDIVDNIKATNDSLETINDTLSGVDTLLNHQNDKIDVTNESLDKLNSLITDGVENNYRQLGDIEGAITRADGNNVNGLTDISGKLQELIDKNDTSSPDLSTYFEGENPFDGNYTDGSENFNAYSAELNASFNSFIITDPLGLNAMGSAYTVPEIGFDIQGIHYNLFGASFMSYVPVELIRALFMFMSVMSGLFVFFRTV